MTTNVLIVEDHPAVRSSLRSWLAASHPEWTFDEVPSAEEALEQLAKSHAPDLVLMDIGLPGMNGIEATRRIKAASPDTQVVIVSMSETEAHRADAAAAGASAYVAKARMGFELPALLKRLLPDGCAERPHADAAAVEKHTEKPKDPDEPAN